MGCGWRYQQHRTFHRSHPPRVPGRAKRLQGSSHLRVPGCHPALFDPGTPVAPCLRVLQLDRSRELPFWLSASVFGFHTTCLAVFIEPSSGPRRRACQSTLGSSAVTPTAMRSPRFSITSHSTGSRAGDHDRKQGPLGRGSGLAARPRSGRGGDPAAGTDGQAPADRSERSLSRCAAFLGVLLAVRAPRQPAHSPPVPFLPLGLQKWQKTM